MWLRLPVYFLISLPVVLVPGSMADSSKKSPAAPAATPPRPPPPSGDPSWALGLRLYRALRSNSDSVNTVFSPLLVASLLEALSGGSAGATASQFRDLLKTPSLTKPGAQAGEFLPAALKSVAEANGTSFHIRSLSAVFTKQAPTVSQAFLKDSMARFRLEHKPLGKGDSKADSKQVYGWVKAGVSGLESTLADEIQTKAGALIVGNALRFRGLWEREFSQSTESADRRTFLGKKYTKVMMMHRAGLYRFHEDIENMVQVLEATLWGGKASVLLLLPFQVESLSRLEKLLTLELLSKWLEKTDVTSVAISMPVTNIRNTLNLRKPLNALGLTEAWDEKTADFSGVSDKGKGKLHLGGVLHWASLELAAKAGKGSENLEEEQIENSKLFYADHPFIIFVRDNATGALLLMGAVDHVEGEALHDEL